MSMSNVGDGMYGSKHFTGRLSRPPPGHMSEARVEALNKKQQRRDFVRRTLKKYDVSNSGGLRWDELKTFLQDLDPTRAEPTEEELKWLIQMSTHDHQVFAGEWKSGRFSLQHDAIADAADHWLSYASSAKDIEKFYDTHDPLKGDAPDKEILAQVLAVANGDVSPSAEEVEWVLKTANAIGNGVTSKPAILMALSRWHSYHEGETAMEDAEGKSEKKEAPTVKQSACCSLQ